MTSRSILIDDDLPLAVGVDGDHAAAGGGLDHFLAASACIASICGLQLLRFLHDIAEAFHGSSPSSAWARAAAPPPPRRRMRPARPAPRDARGRPRRRRLRRSLPCAAAPATCCSIGLIDEVAIGAVGEHLLDETRCRRCSTASAPSRTATGAACWSTEPSSALRAMHGGHHALPGLAQLASTRRGRPARRVSGACPRPRSAASSARRRLVAADSPAPGGAAGREGAAAGARPLAGRPRVGAEQAAPARTRARAGTTPVPLARSRRSASSTLLINASSGPGPGVARARARRPSPAPPADRASARISAWLSSKHAQEDRRYRPREAGRRRPPAPAPPRA